LYYKNGSACVEIKEEREREREERIIDLYLIFASENLFKNRRILLILWQIHDGNDAKQRLRRNKARKARREM